MKNARAAVITAHPDDETLWAGDLLAWWKHNAERRMTVVCCSIPETEPERAVKFFDVCEYYGASGRILPFIEIRGGKLVGLEWLDLKRFDVLFTHNEKGEYGHVHHKQVHRRVLLEDCSIIYQFGPEMDGGEVVELPDSEKLNALRHYNHMSRVMAVPKWRELLLRWGDLAFEPERHIRVK